MFYPMQDYQVEKWIWTEEGFDEMGWHDATVYGVRLNHNLEIDLDYIFEWIQPEVEVLSTAGRNILKVDPSWG